MSTIPSPRKGDGASPRWGLYREVFVSFPQNDATAGPGGGNVNQPLVVGASPRKLVGVLRLDEGAVHQHVGLVEQIARGRIGDALRQLLVAVARVRPHVQSQLAHLARQCGARGGLLELWLGPKPNTRWGTGKLPE